MSFMDRKVLRKMEYPACAKECLSKIESCITNRSKQELAMELIAEFIFCEKTEKDRHHQRHDKTTGTLTLIQEFQLVVVLCEFFSIPGPDATRNAIFLSLFAGSIPASRISVLVKLISTSVTCSIAPLLCAAGTWMQQLGCTNPPSLELAQNLVTDFVVFSRKSSEQLKSLPMVAPRFSANFMTAVADLYLNENSKINQLTAPPDILLEVITEWVSDNPSLCLASLQPLSLPSGAIAMSVLTPLAGLIRWCVLAPICNNNNKNAYSKLHLAILQSLLQTPATAGPPTALNAQHLNSIISIIRAKAEVMAKDKANVDAGEKIQTCIERFAQAIQVAFSSRCIYGSIPQFLCHLETLPSNTLMEIVIKTNKVPL